MEFWVHLFIYLPVWNLISIMKNDMSVNELNILKSDMIIGYLNLFQLWILPSMVGGSVLYFLSVDRWHRVAAWLYGSGLTGLFITSTLFHTAAWKISHLRCVFVCVLGGGSADRDLADVPSCTYEPLR